MRKAFVLLLVVVPFFLGSGCKKAGQGDRDREAIRAAIEKHLSERSDLNRSAMDVKIGQVSIEGNTAQAQVEFQAKGNAAAGFTMQMNYQLERQGNVWVVRGSRAGGDNPMHPPGGAAMPPTPSPSDSVPAGHLAVGGAAPAGDSTGAAGNGKLPAGHPPIGDAAKMPAKKSPAPPKK